MTKNLLLIALIITIGLAQSPDDLLLGPDPLTQQADDGEVAETGNGEELVLDTGLPLSNNFEIDGEQIVQELGPSEPQQSPLHGYDGEQTAAEYIEEKINKVWDDNLFTFSNFGDFFAFVQTTIETKIQTLSEIRLDQHNKCQGLEADIARVEKDIEKIEGFVSWISARIAKNEEKIEEIFDGRCKTHMNYLNFMKNSQITIRLLAFLRSALENYSFVQMKHVGEILQKYANSKKSNEEIMKVMLVELKDIQDRVVVRSNEETGTGHVNNDRKNIEIDNMDYMDRKDLGQYKEQLLQIIATLESDLHAEIERRQNDEIELNEKVIEWTNNLNTEIHELQHHLKDENDNLSAASNDLQTFIYESETCSAELQWITDKIKALQDYLDYILQNQSVIEQLYQAERDKYVLSASLTPNA